MLNLMRVELGKLLRGKVLWITVAAYLVVVAATMVPISYVQDFSDLQNLVPESMAAEMADELEAMGERLQGLNQNRSFIQVFYTSSSGYNAVVMIIVTVFIFQDILAGTLRGTLLSGYSRKQVYASKLFSGLVASWIFFLASMLLMLGLGACFFHLELNADVSYLALKIVLAQCIAGVQYVAVFAAFAFLFGNGWAFLGSTLFFIGLPSVPLTIAFAQGRDQSLAASVLPAFFPVNGVGRFVSLEYMVAMPQLWTPGFLLLSLAVLAVVTTVSTALGMHFFEKKDL